MRKILLLMLGFILFTNITYAQKTTVKGRVTDTNGVGVPSATVKEKGTKNAVSADGEGNFTISVSPNATLQFSATGFGMIELPADKASSVRMKEEIDNLSEVVVTALGVKREKKALGYAVQEVKGENLTVAKSLDISTSLAGKVAGVQLVGSPSSSFDNADILIRGVTGLGPQEPIFVVDGTITNQSAVILDNIESVSVLKGPASTALYGQRAANGAVVITTKKGSRKKFTSVDVNLGLTFEKLALLPPYQNDYAGGYSSALTSAGTAFDAQGFYLFKYNPAIHPASWAAFNGQRMLEYGADESWGPKMNGDNYRAYWSWYPGAEFGQQTPLVAQPNNVKDFFRTGVNKNNSISFSSGGEGYNLRMTYANQNRSLMIPNANRDQHQLALNGSFDIGKYITISTDLTYTTNSTKGKPAEGYRLDGLNITQNFNQWFQRQLDMKRMVNYREPDGSLNSWNIGDPNASADISVYGRPQYWDNPYFMVNEAFSTQAQNRLVGNIGMNIKVNKHLNIQSFVRANTYNNENTSRMPTGALTLDYFNISQDRYSEMNFETNIMYKNKFGDFSVDGMVGGNVRKNSYSALSMGTQGGLSSPNYFDIAASISRPTVGRSYEKKTVNSVLGKASIGWRDLLFVEGTLRNDWSSALPSQSNSYLYPSLSTSFIFTELVKTSWLTYGKLRASFASVGSDLGAHALNLAIGNGSFYGTNPSATIGNQFKGGGIKPALTKAYEFGVELRLFKKIGLDVTYYQNNNTDQILGIDVTPASGFSTAQINAGNIQSKGIEITLSGKPIDTKNFSWDVTLNWAKNQNSIKELAPGINTYLYATNRYDTRLEHRVGGEWGTYYGRKWRTDPTTGQTLIDATGQPLYDINVPIGNVLPKFTGGMFNAFKYKSFDLTFSIDFQSGGLFYSETRNFNSGTGLSQETVGKNDKGNDWRDYPGAYTTAGGNAGAGGIRIPGIFANGALAGKENNRYLSARAYWYTARQRDASNVLLDGSYVKLREIRFGYTIPSSALKSLPFVKSANIGFMIQNAWLIWATTKKWGVDPSELETFYREGGQLSSTRQFGVNLRASF
ncbi:SusC/RagA family TonB-linked outer membrane protein [Sediminibacterium sp.]|uniref:SusC/RagA family TonB-linked outer membrane protein n=1 Tax=Sediminibacterium sp. TaxID=1917865 RepID=UPI0025D95937|nr:SusC/RagA family TonB-linked outer membrane protein [Sediminibacterium sp.]